MILDILALTTPGEDDEVNKKTHKNLRFQLEVMFKSDLQITTTFLESFQNLDFVTHSGFGMVHCVAYTLG